MPITTYIRSTQATSRYVGKCKPCARPVSGTVTGAGDRAVIACPDCSGQVTGERVYGTESAMICDGRCMSATRDSCECQCGGINHASRWSERREMLASELASYRAQEERKAAEREQRRAAERRRAQSEFDTWASAHAGLAAMLSADTEPANAFLYDMWFIVRRGEPLTGRQTEVAERIAGEVAEREARIAADKASAKPVPTGKAIEITGEVVHTRIEDSPFGYNAVVCKMLVRGDGWKVWATIPEAINDVNATTPGNLGGLKGRTVRFVADVQASRDDPAFGYAKRPRKAEILAAITA